MKKISNLFSNNKDKVTSKKLEHQNEVYPLKEIIENEIDDQKNSLINLSENTEKSESKSDQISLLDLDENEKAENIDDVLVEYIFKMLDYNVRKSFLSNLMKNDLLKGLPLVVKKINSKSKKCV